MRPGAETPSAPRCRCARTGIRVHRTAPSSEVRFSVRSEIIVSRFSALRDDGVAHVPHRAVRAGHVPSAPSLAERCPIVRIVAAELRERQAIRRHEHAARQHAGHMQRAVSRGDSVRQPERRSNERARLRLLIDRVENDALLGILDGELEQRRAANVADRDGVVEEDRARIRRTRYADPGRRSSTSPASATRQARAAQSAPTADSRCPRRSVDARTCRPRCGDSARRPDRASAACRSRSQDAPRAPISGRSMSCPIDAAAAPASAPTITEAVNATSQAGRRRVNPPPACFRSRCIG